MIVAAAPDVGAGPNTINGDFNHDPRPNYGRDDILNDARLRQKLLSQKPPA
jgi:hypothetical protein